MATPDRVLFFGTYDDGLHPRVAVLRDGLAARGWEVEELDVPLGYSTAQKVAAATSPAAALRLVARIVVAWARLVAGRWRVHSPEVVVVGYMGHLDVHLARLLFPGATIVLDHLVGLADTVADRRLSSPRLARVLTALDRAALAAADVVVVDTPEQAAELPATVGPVVPVPVGATTEWCEAARRAGPAEGDGPLRVVFFGLFTPLQGAPVIGKAIASLADAPIELTMVGHGQDLQSTKDLAGDDPRVTWLDWVEPGELPDLVAAHDVCLGVFDDGPKAARVVPNKVFQGLAAGCVVVTGDTEAVRASVGDLVTTVPPGDPGALADELQSLAARRSSLRRARAPQEWLSARIGPEAAAAPLHAALSAPAPGPLPPLTISAWYRWDLIAAELDELRPADVLEIGPGEGAIAARLAQGRRYTGAEMSPRTRRMTEELLERRGTPGRLVGHTSELAPGETFDLVCAFEVLEHIEHDQAALAEWASLVRPGGRLMLSVPADPDQMGPADVFVGHLRRYEPGRLRQALQDAGLEDVRVAHIGFPLGYANQAARNLAARRALARRGPAVDAAEGTEASSSFLQPPRWAGLATRAASAPGRFLQRRLDDRGPGLVAVGRRRD